MAESQTALVLIDLQKGIVGMETAPRGGAEVVKNAGRLLHAARSASATVVLVRVGFHGDDRDRLQPPVDQPMQTGKPPADWMQFAAGIEPAESDVLILKHQWGAVHGTDLDLQMRRRGIRTVILGGIATNLGVESTARDLWELGYHLVFAEDAMTSRSVEMHAFSIKTIFPLIGRVRSTDQAIELLRSSAADARG